MSNVFQLVPFKPFQPIYKDESLIVKIITWVALLLLLITYFSLGWALFAAEFPLSVWGIIVIGVILMILLLTIPLNTFKGPIMNWFRSNIGTFIAVIFGAFFLVVLATWVDIFFRIILMLSSILLAKVELQTIGVKHGLSFFILIAIALTGLVLGWEAHYFNTLKNS